MTYTIGPIQTRYAGYHFRSRLEARWAVFFDEVGIEWRYEPEGFQKPALLGDRTIMWLPDFWLPRQNLWVEVKPTRSHLQEQFQDLIEMLDWGSPVPGIDSSYYTNAGGVLLLGDIPRFAPGSRPTHPLLQHHKGVWCAYGEFVPGGFLRTSEDYWDEYHDASTHESVAPEINNMGVPGACHPYVAAAYDAARSARFEHGQSGAT